MRVFLAVNLHNRLQGELAQIQDRLRKKTKGIRWVAPHLLHITLKFLGEWDDDALDVLENPLQEIGKKTAAFTVSLARLGAFPSRNNPRVFWIGMVEGALQLGNLAGEIEQNLEVLEPGRRSEDKFQKTTRQSFRPHITLGRKKKKGERFWAADDLFDAPWACKNTLWVDSFYLMQSKLYPTGPVYTPVRKFLFKKD